MMGLIFHNVDIYSSRTLEQKTQTADQGKQRVLSHTLGEVGLKREINAAGYRVSPPAGVWLK